MKIFSLCTDFITSSPKIFEQKLSCQIYSDLVKTFKFSKLFMIIPF